MSSKPSSTEPQSACVFCGTVGKELYDGLEDRLFGVPGRWRIVCCENPVCGLLWLDPMPVETDFPKTYCNYYTHGNRGGAAALRIGSLYRSLLGRSRLGRQRARLEALCLSDRPVGSVLDVGCGDGAALAMLRQRGWSVLGQELDSAAARRAHQVHQVDVHLGPLETLLENGRRFDAVTMNHVIEHVVDPVATLRTCAALMKGGGVLVCITPNVASFGHRRFGRCWRGLEPPRHLHLFGPSSMHRLAEAAGLTASRIWTTAVRAAAFGKGSLDVQFGFANGMNLLRHARAQRFQWAAAAAHRHDPNSGEELVLECAP